MNIKDTKLERLPYCTFRKLSKLFNTIIEKHSVKLNSWASTLDKETTTSGDILYEKLVKLGWTLEQLDFSIDRLEDASMEESFSDIIRGKCDIIFV
eukprot:sb/3479164/